MRGVKLLDFKLLIFNYLNFNRVLLETRKCSIVATNTSIRRIQNLH